MKKVIGSPLTRPSPATVNAVALIDRHLADLKRQFKAAERAVQITDCATILMMARQLRQLKKEILAND